MNQLAEAPGPPDRLRDAGIQATASEGRSMMLISPTRERSERLLPLSSRTREPRTG